jgi:hypothetical protein
MRSVEAALGGCTQSDITGIMGLAGSLTPTSMADIFNAMRLTSDSILLDAGAGIGRPLVQAAVTYRLPVALGYEFDPIKVQKSIPFIDRCLNTLAPDALTAPIGTDASSHVAVFLGDIATPMGRRSPKTPITHVFSFWEGLTQDARKGVARICQELPMLESVAVVQRAIRGDPVLMMRRYGFPQTLTLIASFPVTSVGSGRQYTAYVYGG